MACRFAALIVAGLALAAGPALAQDDAARLGQAGDTLVMEAEGHRLSMPLPAFFAVGDGTGLSDNEVIITGDENSTRFEIVPEGETAAEWTYLFGARIMLEPERDLATYRQAAAFGYAMSCLGEFGNFFLAREDEEDAFAPLVFLCGQFTEAANRPEEGQITSMVFRRTDAGIAVIYEEFRVPEFDGRDPATWPVAGEALVGRAIELLDQSELVELDG